MGWLTGTPTREQAAADARRLATQRSKAEVKKARQAARKVQEEAAEKHCGSAYRHFWGGR